MNKEAISTTNTQKIESAFALKFNLFDPKFNANPYPTYHRLRESEPVHRYFVGGDWIVTRYADVKAVFKNGCVRTDDRPKSIQERNCYNTLTKWKNSKENRQ